MKPNDIRVRPATMADLDTIVRFNTQMALETEDKELPHQRSVSGVKSILEDSAKGFYILAECDDEVVGQIMINYEWSDWRNSFFWWIQSVYVLPNHRKIGAFRALFQHVERMAQNASNVFGFRLYVHKENHLAKKAYEGLGMEGSHYELYEKTLDQSE